MLRRAFRNSASALVASTRWLTLDALSFPTARFERAIPRRLWIRLADRQRHMTCRPLIEVVVLVAAEGSRHVRNTSVEQIVTFIWQQLQQQQAAGWSPYVAVCFLAFFRQIGHWATATARQSPRNRARILPNAFRCPSIEKACSPCSLSSWTNMPFVVTSGDGEEERWILLCRDRRRPAAGVDAQWNDRHECRRCRVFVVQL